MTPGKRNFAIERLEGAIERHIEEIDSQLNKLVGDVSNSHGAVTAHFDHQDSQLYGQLMAAKSSALNALSLERRRN